MELNVYSMCKDPPNSIIQRVFLNQKMGVQLCEQRLKFVLPRNLGLEVVLPLFSQGGTFRIDSVH